MTFLLFARITAIAQSPFSNLRFEQITVDQGLAQSAAYCMEEDQFGNLWFGTRGGLSKYNGYDFVNYQQNDDESIGLSNSSIYSLLNTEDNILWIGTADGLNAYDRVTESFKQYKDPKLSGNIIRVIEYLNKDTLLLGTQEGLLYFDTKNDRVVKNEIYSSLSGINDILVKPDRVIIGSDLGLFVGEKGELSQITNIGVSNIFEDKKGKLWVGEQVEMLNIFSKDLKLLNSIELGGVKGILQGDDEHVIVAAGSLHIYDNDGNWLDVNSHEPNNPSSLSRDNIAFIYKSNGSILWAGTNGYGINKYDPNALEINLVNNKNNISSGLMASEYISSIYSSDDNIVSIGTSNGLHLYDKTNGSIRQINNDFILSMHANEDRLYIPGGNGKMKVYSLPSYRLIEEFMVQDMTLPRHIVTDKNGVHWIGDRKGLIKFNCTTKQQQLFIPKPKNQPFPTEDWITAILIMDKYMLIGTHTGIYRFDPESFTYEKIEKIDSAFNSLAKTFVKSLYRDKNGAVWIGTWGDGVYHWDIEQNVLNQYRKEQGLPDDVIYGVLEDEKGMYWMSSNNGLSRYNPANNSFFNLDYDQGLQSREYNTGAYFKSNAGLMYFGGIKGLNYFDPNKLKRNQNIPNTIIDGISINNKRQNGSEVASNDSISIGNMQRINLKHDQNMIRIDLLGTNLTDPEKNQYAYYMEGLEEDWYEVGNLRYASYLSIPPGDYLFRAKSANNDGVWDTTPLELRITISPPFWNTWWFRLAVFLFITFALVSIYIWRTRQLRSNERKLQATVKERTIELEKSLNDLKKAQVQLVQSEKMASLGMLSAGIGHEINNPLNFIKNGTFALENKLKDSKLDESLEIKPILSIIFDGVDRASKIVRSLGHFSRQGKGLDEICDIHAILDNCTLLLNSELNEKIVISKGYHNVDLLVRGNEGKLHQAFFNLISNSIFALHDDGTIEVNTSIDKGMVVVSIKDSGTGIGEKEFKNLGEPFNTSKSSKDGVGLGLFITYSIVAEHQGIIEVESELNIGTTFLLKFKQLEG